MADSSNRVCKIDGCDRSVRAWGWCSLHWRRWRNTGDPGPAHPLRNPQVGSCTVVGCDSSLLSRGYCGKHYQRWQKWGDPTVVTRATGRTWTDKDGYVKVWDPGDGYGSGRAIQQHRLVMERMIGRPLRAFETVHHINGIRSDNRPENLELWCKPHVPGRRPEDLAEWVVKHYPELVRASLDKRNQLRLM